MKGDRIAYYSGIKYVLATPYMVQTDIRPPFDITTEYVDLTTSGLLIMRHGFPWDGPSGPCPDIRKMMRASLVHDALAELMRQGYLDFETYFHAINEELRKIAREDGLAELAAGLVFVAVDKLSDGKWAKFCSDGEGGARPLHFAP